MKHHRLDHLPFKVNVHYSNRKSTELRLISQDVVEVRTPFHTSEKSLFDLINEKRDWIDKHRIKMKLNHNKRNTLISDPERQVLFLGNVLSLVTKEDKGKNHASVVRRESVLEITAPSVERAYIDQVLIQWYKDMAKLKLKEQVDHYSDRLDLRPNRIFIKDQKTRWGSCSSKRNINLNWRLIKAPIEVIDAIIVHELCHLKHLNHSSEFWQLVESSYPDYHSRHKWLSIYGAILMN
ncbi:MULTISPECIES: M48 family metallopeptidase [unclassified Fusibacter]|uniref:M48 family metallopeptidase n=1 Tax=unclassified Fusibacter TaxID=2624464 RepID=UPI0010136E46|nr:SprT family zinc-dependent metalloprotease [Fusibacter sp. A1]MCK8058579.1 M48 family metallopeptidase [Fusibacter sp. A2]NPE22651.1 M48 family metallopeptidase [Fusibacter sp. A1]RXV60214.1 M48 family peptidase [Fusibacter sp. A1]